MKSIVLGNTCYANSVLQSLYHSIEFRKQVRSHEHAESLIGELSALFSALEIKKRSTAPDAFINQLRRSNQMFNNTLQHDAHEFLNHLLNALPCDCINTFKGTLANETKCLECENITNRTEEFLDLSIDIHAQSSITACLRAFSASEMLDEKNKFFCEACGSYIEAEKRMRIKELPSVLALHLKRFKYQESARQFTKLNYRVAFPEELRLFNTTRDAFDGDRLYELYAIVIHIGSGPSAGHYICAAKKDGSWLLFDDDYVSELESLDQYFGDNPNQGSAYVLFYQSLSIENKNIL